MYLPFESLTGDEKRGAPITKRTWEKKTRKGKGAGSKGVPPIPMGIKRKTKTIPESKPGKKNPKGTVSCNGKIVRWGRKALQEAI